MSGWGVLVFATIGIVAYYFGTQAHGNRSARSADGGADTDGDLKMSDFSWAPGHHHADGGSMAATMAARAVISAGVAIVAARAATAEASDHAHTGRLLCVSWKL